MFAVIKRLIINAFTHMGNLVYDLWNPRYGGHKLLGQVGAIWICSVIPVSIIFTAVVFKVKPMPSVLEEILAWFALGLVSMIIWGGVLICAYVLIEMFISLYKCSRKLIQSAINAEVVEPKWKQKKKRGLHA